MRTEQGVPAGNRPGYVSPPIDEATAYFVTPDLAAKFSNGL
jgi:hypothetical protein